MKKNNNVLQNEDITIQDEIKRLKAEIVEPGSKFETSSSTNSERLK